MFEIFKSEIVRNKSLVGKYVLIVLLLWTANIITPYISGQYINFLVDTTDAGTTIILYYNKHGTGYGSQPYSIPTRT